MEQYQPPQPPQEFPSSSVPPQKTSMGMEPNMAAALSYLCGWVTGLIFFLMEKENNFVRFHAMQSIVTFGGLTVLSIALSIIGMLPVPGTGILSFLGHILIGIVGFVAWILLILKAYQGERFHLPVVGDIAEKNSK
jgi:uncharacterized membrane protein